MSGMSRRKTLALIGGGVILAAGAGTWHVARPAHAARAPWTDAGRYADPRMRALSWAILAPNPHNRQPWKVDLSQAGAAVLYADTERFLPHTDPFSRQIVIGLGCFLETLAMAAAADGFRTEVTLFPDGSDPEHLDSRPVAWIRFAEGAEPDPDFDLIGARRTNRRPYDLSRPVPSEDMALLVAAARHGSRGDGTVLDSEVAELRVLSEEAMQIEIDTPHTYRESVDLFRIGRAEVNANPDGISFTGPLFEMLHRTGQFSRALALDRSSSAYASGVDTVMENMRTAMGHVWLCTRGNSRSDQIAAGRDWMRLHLAATRAGLGVQPLSQALQEYPEMAELYSRVHDRLAKPGETVQMWARVGYAPEVPASPRWPIEAKVLNG
ncbi:MAG: twin-arginine translocation pathway signal protein [Pseudomonadota bacterium]